MDNITKIILNVSGYTSTIVMQKLQFLSNVLHEVENSGTIESKFGFFLGQHLVI